MPFSDNFKEFHEIQLNNELRLRQHVPEKDAQAFFEIYQDIEAFQYFGGYSYPGDTYTEEFTKVLQSRLKSFKAKRDYSWVVDYVGKAIGQIQLYDFQDNNTICTIGYFLSRDYWNQGINTRCIKAVSEFAIRSMKIERIEAYANVENKASNRSLEKAGYTYEGCLRNKSYINKQFHDVNLWSFIKGDLQ